VTVIIETCGVVEEGAEECGGRNGCEWEA